jgi:acyl-CoA synthetase (AMP-forming)/AMP-acid ligase II
LIIGTETNLAFKQPRENLTLLKQIAADLTSRKIKSESIPSLRNIILVDNSSGRIDTSPLTSTTPFCSLLSNSSHSVHKPDSPLDPNDITTIQFTSGTTSLPKAACLTHRSILNNGYFIGERMALTTSDIIVCPPPLFHCFGCILGYMASATHGSCIIFPSEAFSPLATLLAVQENRATALYGVATMFAAELELISNGTVKNEGWENLRTGIAAGSSVPAVLMGKLHERLNLTGLTICYGMTETSPVSFMTGLDDPLQKRLDSVGRLLPHVDAKIVSEHDESIVLPLGERGELAVAGYNVMTGYWGDEAKTLEVRKLEKSENGEEKVWMYTGDEAVMDAEGYVRITGRIKDLIIRGGENIHPLEIENVLFAHPKVSEASVVGLPDEHYGECVAAFVVVHGGVVVDEDVVDDEGEVMAKLGSREAQGKLHPGEVLTKQELRDWVRKQLSGHLVPKYIFWTDNYPKTPSGKIQKFKLVQEGIKLRGDGHGL